MFSHKGILAVILLCLIHTSCSLVIKKIARLSSPRVESRESISRMINKAGLGTEEHYILSGGADSAAVYHNLVIAMKREIQVYDSSGNRLCYVGGDGCKGRQVSSAFSSPSEFYKVCSNDSNGFNHKLRALNLLQTGKGNNDSAAYIILIHWSRFFGGEKELKENAAWMRELRSNTVKPVRVIWVNTDLQEEWGLEEGKKMKLKFRYLGNKSATMEFGEIPGK